MLVQERLRQRCVDKLNPRKIQPSPAFSATLACMLGTFGWADPNIAQLTCTSDGFILGRAEGDYGFNMLLGSRADLLDNVLGIADAANLTKLERTYLVKQIPSYA